MIGRLALALERSGVDLDPVRLAEILWVATHGHGAGWAEGESPQPIRDDDEERGPDDDAAGQPAALEPEETPAAPTDTRAPLYLVPRPAVPDEESQRLAVEVRLPGPAALPGRLQLGRALRVLKRERPVSRVGTLDLDATIKQYGDTGLLTPLMRPAAERWFDVALVVDGGPTMDVWAQTTVELTKLLESHGAFRRVRRWRLVEQSGEPWLLNDAGARHHLRQLAEPEGRQVTMVVTDCVGAQWYSSPIWSAIQDWGRHGPVVLVQPLPPRLWESTALGPVDVRLTGYRPGQPNRGLRITLPWWWMAEEQPAGAVPVIALTEPDVSRWARMVMGAAGVPVLGVIAEAGPPVDLDDVPAAEPDPAARVASFRSTVSPEAYQLAVCLAAVPVRLPIARIVQYGVLGSHDLVHLAEVFASGLLRRVTPPGANVPIDDVEYAFVAGVREILQQSLTGVRTLEIFRSVARYLEAILGRPANFTALLTAAPDADSIDEDFQPFAEIAAHLIDLLDLGQDLVAAAATAPPPPEPQRTDPLPWGHAILVGTDKQIDQFEQWLISPRGGGLPPERVFVAASPESLPHALRDAAGAASAEGRQPGVLFLLEYGTFDQNPEFEEGTEWSAFSSFARVTLAASPPTLPMVGASPPIRYAHSILPARDVSVVDVIDALSGRAEDDNGAITAVSLGHYLGRKASDWPIGVGSERIVLRPGRPIPIAHRRALVVGIDNVPAWPSSKMDSPHSIADARVLADQLRQADFRVTLLTGREVTRDRFLTALNEMVASSTADDLLWVHISTGPAEWEPGTGMTALVPYATDLPSSVSINHIRDLLATGTSAAVVLTDEVRQDYRSQPSERPTEQFSMYGSVREFVRVSCLTEGATLGSRGPLVHFLLELLADPVEPATLERLSALSDRLEHWGREAKPPLRVIRSFEAGTSPSALLRGTPPPVEPVLDIELVEIPGGPFSMGLTASQANELKRESYTVTPANPVRTVVVGNFSISRYPITNAQYAEFVAATGTAPPRHWKGMAPPAAIRDHPVVWVIHARARQYCEWLAMRTGMPYRLPTSEEWEKAARGAADQRRFPWGETLDPSRCAYRKRKTVPVHAFSPQGDSPYHVADLVGNAREWTHTTITDRWGSETAVVRGGGIIARRDFELWCAYLTERSTSSPAATIGFRVALG